MDLAKAILAVAMGFAVTSCSQPVTKPTENAVIALGGRPAADLTLAIPQRAVVCFGLHYGLLTEAQRGPADPLLPGDLEKTCREASLELAGDCAAYASAAAHLGAVAADKSKRPVAEADAEAALRRCKAL